MLARGFSQSKRLNSLSIAENGMAQSTVTKHGIEYTTLLAETEVTAAGTTVPMTASVTNFDAAIIVVRTDSSEKKTFFVPKPLLESRIEVSWNATDSIEWYVIFDVVMTGASMKFNKFEKNKFSHCYCSVYGLKSV